MGVWSILAQSLSWLCQEQHGRCRWSLMKRATKVGLFSCFWPWVVIQEEKLGLDDGMSSRRTSTRWLLYWKTYFLPNLMPCSFFVIVCRISQWSCSLAFDFGCHTRRDVRFKLRAAHDWLLYQKIYYLPKLVPCSFFVIVSRISWCKLLREKT